MELLRRENRLQFEHQGNLLLTGDHVGWTFKDREDSALWEQVESIPVQDRGEGEAPRPGGRRGQRRVRARKSSLERIPPRGFRPSFQPLLFLGLLKRSKIRSYHFSNQNIISEIITKETESRSVVAWGWGWKWGLTMRGEEGTCWGREGRKCPQIDSRWRLHTW